MIEFFAEYLDKTLLFLIDEYEYLFAKSFDNPVGFMMMRSLGSRVLQNGLSPFSFWIAGAKTWSYLCTETGSGELNVLDGSTIYITPIDKNSFHAMWLNGINSFDNEELKKTLLEKENFAFIASGGVPFFGKQIGNYIFQERKDPDFTLLKSYFMETEKNLTSKEKHAIRKIIKHPENGEKDNARDALILKGLIRNLGKYNEITIGFFRDFILDSEKKNQRDPTLETEKYTNKIMRLIENINETYRNKTNNIIFDRPAFSQIESMKVECNSSDKFTSFTTTLYLIIYEGTQDNQVKKGRIPDRFKNTKFVKAVDTLRHSFGKGHNMEQFIYHQGQMTKSEVLNWLIKDDSEPYRPDDFKRLQLEILKKFNYELENIRKYICAINGIQS